MCALEMCFQFLGNMICAITKKQRRISKGYSAIHFTNGAFQRIFEEEKQTQ